MNLASVQTHELEAECRKRGILPDIRRDDLIGKLRFFDDWADLDRAGDIMDAAAKEITELRESIEFIRDNLPDGCACTVHADGSPYECNLCFIRQHIDEVLA